MADVRVMEPEKSTVGWFLLTVSTGLRVQSKMDDDKQAIVSIIQISAAIIVAFGVA